METQDQNAPPAAPAAPPANQPPAQPPAAPPPATQPPEQKKPETEKTPPPEKTFTRAEVDAELEKFKAEQVKPLERERDDLKAKAEQAASDRALANEASLLNVPEKFRKTFELIADPKVRIEEIKRWQKEGLFAPAPPAPAGSGSETSPPEDKSKPAATEYLREDELGDVQVGDADYMRRALNSRRDNIVLPRSA